MACRHTRSAAPVRFALPLWKPYLYEAGDGRTQRQMKILLSSHAFSPRIGGIETASEILAEEFLAAGHEVRVVTQTLETGERAFPFPVLRDPGARALYAAVEWCDVFFHNNISLQTAWPLLVLRRPWVVMHQTWIPRTGLAGRVKRFVLRFAQSIAISRAVALELDGPCVLIPNPYRDEVFRPMPGVARERELIFTGRLVPDKGCDLMLIALWQLRKKGLRPRLTIVGSGMDEEQLREIAVQLGVIEQVIFTGTLTGDDLARALHGHLLQLVPSLWAEPFGIVALEGIACGCYVIGSQQGGLREAIGPCGSTFPNGDGNVLAKEIERVLADVALREAALARAPEHLARHRRRTVAAQCLEVLERALQCGVGKSIFQPSGATPPTT